MTIKEKFDNINFEELPEHLQSELETIKDETSDFDESGDEAKEIMDVWRVPFQYIYTGILKKYPTALKDYVPPQPSEEELEEQRKQNEFDELIVSGDGKFQNKDYDGALECYKKALELGVNNNEADSRITRAQAGKDELAAERIKQEKAAKAKAIADKYKKKNPEAQGAEA